MIEMDEETFAIAALEERARKLGVAGNVVRPLFSIAISLKRLGDALELIAKSSAGRGGLLESTDLLSTEEVTDLYFELGKRLCDRGVSEDLISYR